MMRVENNAKPKFWVNLDTEQVEKAQEVIRFLSSSLLVQDLLEILLAQVLDESHC